MVFNSTDRPVLGKQSPFVLHSMDYQTEVTIVGYRWFPLAPFKLSEITFNNTVKNFLQYHNDVEQELKKVEKEQKNVANIVQEAKHAAEQVDQKATEAEATAEKALAGQIFGKVVKNIENY